MRLPNAENARIDIQKLTKYALDSDSPRGRHKARVFQSALGYTSENADDLKTAVLKAVLEADCAIVELDFYGQRYSVDCRIKTDVGDAIVRTGWIIRRSEDFPRLTTCFVPKDRRDAK